MSNSRATGRRGRPPADAESIGVDELIEQLVAHFPRAKSVYSTSQAAETAEEIVCDTEVGGVRYVILRAPKAHHAPVLLSPRECQIVELVAAGHPNKIIADELEISSFTVSTYLRRIFAKLGVGSRAAMIARSYEFGITGQHRSYRRIAQVKSDAVAKIRN